MAFTIIKKGICVAVYIYVISSNIRHNVLLIKKLRLIYLDRM